MNPTLMEMAAQTRMEDIRRAVARTRPDGAPAAGLRLALARRRAAMTR